MFPMISTVEEIRRARQLVSRAQAELDARNLPYDPEIKIGVMIEVPSAAIMADRIAAEVDFLSIGTNDLIQYLLAVDRDNTAVAPLYQQFDPAVLKTIKMIIDAGHQRNVWVGMCGEMAGDPLATILLVGLGLDEFSVIPSVLPEIKKIIRSVRFKQAKRIAEKAVAMNSPEEIRSYLSSIIKDQIPDIPLEP
jgi:phosphotransferase system enzyme I (PtsI)